MSDIIIGIDLGTTNSEVAVVRGGRPEVIAVEDSHLLPSVVGLADDGSLLVGQAARNQYVLHPDRTIKSIKRRMGEDTQVSMGDQKFSPQEISALILGRLKRAAEEEVTLGALLRDPREREQTLPIIPLLLAQGEGRELLPPEDRRILPGDRLLLCGCSLGRSRLGWTLQNVHSLNYVLTGGSAPEGAIWQWLSRRLASPRAGQSVPS